MFEIVEAYKGRPIPGLSTVLVFSGDKPDELEMRIYNLGAIRSVFDVRPGFCRIGFQSEFEELKGPDADWLVGLLAASSALRNGASMAQLLERQQRWYAIQRAWAWVKGMLFGSKG